MSRLDERFLDELKQRIRLSDYIGKTVKLKRQGREYAGLSPFSKEKSPSFFVNDDKGFYHCFSSGKHGDLIAFLQETERLTFREAVERLAAEAGMQMPADNPQQQEQDAKRLGLQDVLEVATRFYEEQLSRTVGLAARGYLAGRGFPQDEWARFRVGFAPDGRTALKDHLAQRGIKVSLMVDSGLLIAPEDGTEPYDRFRNRIMFPISDHRGRVVSFSGRTLGEARAKYLNGPETPVFSKGRMLYGLAEARRLMGIAGQKAPLVAAEGCMDAIAFQRADVGAVAPLGTALSEDQLELLWKAHPDPILCFDGDAAGQRAAGRAIEIALPLLRPGRSLWFSMIQDFKDPDELLQKRGAGAVRAAIANPHSMVSVLFELERRREPLDTPERRTALRDRLNAAARTINDKSVAEAYREDLMRRWSALTKPARRQPVGARPALSAEGRAAAAQLTATLDPYASAVVHTAIDRPSWVDDVMEDLSRELLGSPVLNRLAARVIEFRMSQMSGPVRRWLEDLGAEPAMREVERAARRSGRNFLDPTVPADVAKAGWIELMSKVTRLTAIEYEVEDLRDDLSGEGAAERLVRLKNERDQLRRELRG